MEEYCDVVGKRISYKDLTENKSKELCLAIEGNPFVELVEIVKQEDGSEVLIVNVEVELSQRTINDIRNVERMAILVHVGDIWLPTVLALRKDFPKVPHLNITQNEIPRCLCLYAEQYEELKLKWSNYSFIERIREWLSLTAKGKLHQEDQILEPFLLPSFSHIVLPDGIFSNNDAVLLEVEKVESVGRYIYITKTQGTNDKGSKQNCIVLPIIGKAHTHGIIESTPQNLSQLEQFLRKAAIDLLSFLRERLKNWFHIVKEKQIFENPMVFVIALPQKREDEVIPESCQVIGFVTQASLKDIGIALGVWSMIERQYGLVVPTDTSSGGETIKVEMLNVIRDFTRDSAQLYNGNAQEDTKISLVGTGALGSQIFNNLIRQGIGTWTLIDIDTIMPHNLARHILGRFDIGVSKANALMKYANALLGNNIVESSHQTNVSFINEKDNKEVAGKLIESQIILDVAASIPVSRTLTHDSLSDAKRISCFYTPSGNDSIIIAEGTNREVKLDMLEMQYYREIVNNEDFSNHIEKKEGQYRYGGACRDLSTILPFEKVVLHGSLMTKEIKKVINSSLPKIVVYKTNDNMEVKRYKIPTSQEVRLDFGEWKLVYDEELIRKIREHRENKLPNETGGVLIGSYDRQRHIIYVVDTISSPKDSLEWPTVYIRGIRSLKSKIKEYEKRTGDMIEYVGEWHSHPKGCPPRPSEDDMKAFLLLKEAMNESGLVALMLIVSEEYKFYLGKMVQ